MTGAPPDPPAQLIPARLRWQGDQPFSRQFGDIYHSPDGAAEVERVFVEPQHLTERFARPHRVFTVGELGFGTGLNFAVVAQRYLDRAPPGARLHFISFEKHPITEREFADLARRRTRALPIYHELSRGYPPLLAGWHRRHFAGGRVTLSVFFGDGAAGLADITGRQRVSIDAWLLDGFAPDRNGALWTDALWRTIADLSGDGTTLATFSAVGAVRRSLAECGFSMRKVDQRPHKRHSLAGTFAAHRVEYAAPRSVAVVGAGFAGAATARQLADRGIAVTLFDAAAAPANRMAATLFHPRLLPDGDPRSRLRSLGYLYSTHWYERTEAGRRPAGALQFPSPTMPASRLELAANAYAGTGSWVMPVDAGTASSLVGLPVRHGALFFPHGRALDLAVLGDELVRHPSIDYRPGSIVRDVATDDAGAVLSLDAGAWTYDQIVLCAGTGANGFEQAQYLELLPVWGQIDEIAVARAPAMPIVRDGFMTQAHSGWGVGATYEHKPWPAERATEFNLQRFDAWWRDLTGTDAARRELGRLRGVRAVSSDRMPIVGGLFDTTGRRHARLSVNTGHGSQGTVSAPFAAEWIASELTGEFAPCTRAEAESFSSMRFRVRQARRGPRHGARE